MAYYAIGCLALEAVCGAKTFSNFRNSKKPGECTQARENPSQNLAIRGNLFSKVRKSRLALPRTLTALPEVILLA
jgi:hypothetical protein